MKRPITVLTLVLLGCTRSASNHEELGDRSYAAAAYADALAEYQLGRRANAGSAALLAKVAAAAMHTEDYELAASPTARSPSVIGRGPTKPPMDWTAWRKQRWPPMTARRWRAR